MIQPLIDLLSRFPIAVLLSLSIIGVISGDYFAKSWSVNRQPLFFILGMIGYLASGLFYTPTLLKKGLVITSVIWSVVSTIGFILIGVLIFKEELSPLQIAGVALGSVALVLFAF